MPPSSTTTRHVPKRWPARSSRGAARIARGCAGATRGQWRRAASAQNSPSSSPPCEKNGIAIAVVRSGGIAEEEIVIHGVRRLRGEGPCTVRYRRNSHATFTNNPSDCRCRSVFRIVPFDPHESP